MTRERATEKDNPATDPPRRENGQGKHEGTPHKPEEFDVMNPAKPENLRQEKSSPHNQE
ncbi:hypothetical protein [Paracoccus sp. (in: a-proteobacteria)]|uniref:hypothetical protein n=1 Tax=Paracoccus sp. TaxID=267 RepID=UPI002AFFB3F8|nr:hypothetical protein [Paracoccus sp. (in: a-proteobacteria)]